MLRKFTQTDLPQLVSLEATTQIYPWTAEVFQRCWDAGYSGWVIEKNDFVIGFVLATYQVGECHILNLCVHPDYQRQGFGQQLIKHALEIAKTKKANSFAYLEVRRSNVNAIALYNKLGFVQIGERKRYYHGENGHEDALVFAKDLSLE